MQLKQIMQESVLTVTEDVLAEEAWHRMNVHQIHHLVVLRGHEVVGVISERDLGGKYGSAVCDGKVVAELMSSEIVTASPETTVAEAANILRGYSIGCLPILENNTLVGIITITDLLELIVQLSSSGVSSL